MLEVTNEKVEKVIVIEQKVTVLRCDHCKKMLIKTTKDPEWQGEKIISSKPYFVYISGTHLPHEQAVYCSVGCIEEAIPGRKDNAGIKGGSGLSKDDTT